MAKPLLYYFQASTIHRALKLLCIPHKSTTLYLISYTQDKESPASVFCHLSTGWYFICRSFAGFGVQHLCKLGNKANIHKCAEQQTLLLKIKYFITHTPKFSWHIHERSVVRIRTKHGVSASLQTQNDRLSFYNGEGFCIIPKVYTLSVDTISTRLGIIQSNPALSPNNVKKVDVWAVPDQCVQQSWKTNKVGWTPSIRFVGRQAGRQTRNDRQWALSPHNAQQPLPFSPSQVARGLLSGPIADHCITGASCWPIHTHHNKDRNAVRRVYTRVQGPGWNTGSWHRAKTSAWVMLTGPPTLGCYRDNSTIS